MRPLQTGTKALSFGVHNPSLTGGISINTLAEPNPDLEAADSIFELHGERYFVAKTKTGVCVVNYQPDIDRYVGGPFLTWGGAYTCLDVYGESRRRNCLLACTVGVALSGLLYVLL
jgi:hypothetical protein